MNMQTANTKPHKLSTPQSVQCECLEQTQALGKKIAQMLKPGQLIYLNGELGAGKTTLVASILSALGHEGNIKSPTFTIVEPYHFAQFEFYHFDLYRLHSIDELEEIGFRDYLANGSICIIEWANKFSEQLPKPTLTIEIKHNANTRNICIS